MQKPVVGSGPHAWQGLTVSALQSKQRAAPPASSAPEHIAASSRSTLLPVAGLPFSATSVRRFIVPPPSGPVPVPHARRPLRGSSTRRPHQRGGPETPDQRQPLGDRLGRPA